MMTTKRVNGMLGRQVTDKERVVEPVEMFVCGERKSKKRTTYEVRTTDAMMQCVEVQTVLSLNGDWLCSCGGMTECDHIRKVKHPRRKNSM